MHRLSLLLQDGLAGIPDRPFDALSQAFRRHFVGTTYEMRLKAEAEGAEGASFKFEPLAPTEEASANKQFLSIPVQPNNKTLMQALEDFTAWSSTGGTEVAWTQERFRTLPPFLCFASRQVSALDWEDSLELTRYVVPGSSAVQKDSFERSKAAQSQADLQDALEPLHAASGAVSKANTRASGHGLAAHAARLAEVVADLEAQLESQVARLAELDKRLEEAAAAAAGEAPPLEVFLAGAAGAAVVRDVVRGLLGADSVEKLADLAIEAGSDEASNTFDTLVKEGKLSSQDAAGIVARCRTWREERSIHRFDLHALVVYQGMGQFGHYIAFIRQANGAFLCFDDEQVHEHGDANSVRSEIAERASEGCPASVRMVVYRRRCGAHVATPLELDAPPLAGGTNGATVNGARAP